MDIEIFVYISKKEYFGKLSYCQIHFLKIYELINVNKALYFSSIFYWYNFYENLFKRN